ncbi:MAG TPA: O-antigen polymerase [Chthonomonadaceae bacterium]|nr:O-antigen polymerase [Chthonomonadaceae bacterium]
MRDALIILLCVVIGSLPVVLVSAGVARRWGFGLWLFSPLPTYLFAYLVAFGVLPTIQAVFDYRAYEMLSVNHDVFVLAEILGALANYAFAAGYCMLSDRGAAAPSAELEPPAVDVRLYAARCQRVAFGFCIAVECLFMASLLQVHALTLDFGANRQAYLNAIVGAGYISLFTAVGVNLLIAGTLLAVWSGRLGKIGVVAIGQVLAVNSLITARSTVTLVIFALLFAYVMVSDRTQRKIRWDRIIAIMLAVVALGTLLGLSRLSGDPDAAIAAAVTASDNTAMRTIPPLVRPVVFLSLTFDMEVLFEQTLMNSPGPEYGSSWFEDIVYTYAPRALFPDKPVVYGTTRTQAEVAPEITGGVMLTGTFPIGIWGEAYLNFGYVGVFVTMFFLGAMLKYCYNKCLQLTYDSRVNWACVFFAVLYVAQGSNSLGYVRGFGPFLASLLATGFLLWLCLCAIRFLGRESQRPARAAPLSGPDGAPGSQATG